VLIRMERKMTSKMLYALLHTAHSDSTGRRLYSVVFWLRTPGCHVLDAYPESRWTDA
jgi:hypothetical protein